jgi:3-methyladenine DNA glycosylase/8-oxoguanine DNA glycosylase
VRDDVAVPLQDLTSPAAYGRATSAGDAEREWRPAWSISLGSTLSPLRRGAGDPSLQVVEGTVWWAFHGNGGPVTLALKRVDGVVHARAWGPGGEGALMGLPRMLGAHDDLAGFDASAHPVLAAAFPLTDRWRMLRTDRVLDALVPAILEQRVTGLEARRAWRTLLVRHGSPAPGPTPLRLPPTPQRWARIPSWDWHRAGVDPGRARTVVAAVERASALERLGTRRPAEARAALATLPGIGAWTAAEVAAQAWGDADAVPYGDFHLARDVVWALTGRFDGTDDDLAELLEPWAGHRGRAARLIRMHAGHQPRRGPRATVTDHRRW